MDRWTDGWKRCNAPSQIIPDLHDHYSGSWTNQGCTATSDFLVANACAALPSGSGFDLVLTQNGSTVQGTLTIGSFPFTVNGPVASDGTITLSGHGTSGGLTGDLSNWSTQVASTTMTGSFTYILTAPGVAVGSVTVRAGLVSVVRVS